VSKKYFFLLLLTTFVYAGAVAAQKSPKSPPPLQIAPPSTGWSEEIKSDQGQYKVSVEPDNKKVEIRRIDPSVGEPPHLRVKILRKNAEPLEVDLHTIEPPSSHLLYRGTIDRWNQSYIGLQVDFSFDRKTWKKLGILHSSQGK